MKRIFALVLALSLVLAGCGGSQAEDLTKSFRPGVAPGSECGEGGPIVTDFGIRLLQSSNDPQKNMLISPLSIITALSMTANGAANNTLEQMEAVLGADIGSLNGYLSSVQANTGSELLPANSIWIRETPTLTVEDSFLQANADYYGAGVFKAPFDEGTRKEINRWVEEQTDGEIRDMLDRIPEDAMLYLVNALAFEAKWATVYESYQVRERDFTTESGEVKTVEMMYSTEGQYLETENAEGFLKYYEGKRYAFAALLPKEGISLEELVRTLTAQELHGALTTPREIIVHAGLPKFQSGYDTELSEVLAAMGMTDAFDYRVADFSAMGHTDDGTNLCIGRVLHKTAITVAEEGTKAGAATMVEMLAEGAAEIQEESRTVILNRPFLYMIIDTETAQPIFLGTMVDPQ